MMKRCRRPYRASAFEAEVRPPLAGWAAALALALLIATGCDLFESESLQVRRTTFGSDAGRDRAMGAVLLPGGEIVSYGEAEGSHPPYDVQDALPFVLWSGVDGAILDTTVFRDIRYGMVMDAVATNYGLVTLTRKSRGFDDLEHLEMIVSRLTDAGPREDLCRFPEKHKGELVKTGSGDVYFSIAERDGLSHVYDVNCNRIATYEADVLDAAGTPDGTIVMATSEGLVSINPRTGEADVLYSANGFSYSLVTSVGDGVAAAASDGQNGVLLRRVSASGDALWETHISKGTRLPTALAPAPEGGVLLSYIESGGNDARLVAVAADGEVLRDHRFGRNGTLRDIRGLIALSGGRIAGVGSEGTPFEAGVTSADFDVLIEIHEWP